MLANKIKLAYQKLNPCNLCPRKCGVNRLNNEVGFCGMEKDIYISSYGPHFGEESELVGKFGSGTIFFTGCNLKCCFCQNYEISHLNVGYKIEIDDLVNILLKIQNMRCHNINLVTPTHFTPQIMDAILKARNKGLKIPIVYNCGGYESVETLKLLEGFINIYMPDIKFLDEKLSVRYCSAKDYPQIVKEAVKEMHRQVGELKITPEGIAKEGLLVRHLIMPNNLSNTKEVIKFVFENVSPNTYFNLMDQYYPSYQADKYSELRRRIIKKEYQEVIKIAKKIQFKERF
jgi:putative pyruvate formate lyase activating enzyme